MDKEIEIRTYPVGPIDENCYLVWNRRTKEGFVIDPGDEQEHIWDAIKNSGMKVMAILNTHAHGDHIGAIEYIREKTGAPFMISEDEAPYLFDATKNLSAFMEFGARTTAKPDRLLKDGSTIKCDGVILEAIATPGHSPGGMCYLGDGVLFSGDTLFRGSVGRTDFPSADTNLLKKSVHDKLLPLPDDTLVLPGHGPETTIGEERATNPFFV